MNPYQVKIAVKNNSGKFKSKVISGVVIAKNQVSAVALAMENIREHFRKEKEDMNVKLISAQSLGNGFVFIEQIKEPQSEIEKNK